MKNLKIATGVLVAMLALIYNLKAQDETYTDFSAEVNADYRGFFNEGLYSGQKQSYLSLAVKPEFVHEWKDGKHIFKTVLFGRLDQHDSRRTHFDIRELYWQTAQGDWELSVGLKKVFWGVTESAHLVDIINQADVVESFDGEEKLGQPMVHYSRLTRIGTFDLFVLPYFRKQVFPGTKGRLRTPFVLNDSFFEFESSAEEYRPDVAARYSHYFGVFDVGVSYFNGTGRDPIVADLETFQAIYGVISQVGIDVQATTGPLLWKVEAIDRRNDVQDMRAFVGGLEYTFGNIANRGLDIGIIGEYLYDDRDELALNSLQNDLFIGSRIAFNDVQDTEILVGGIFDLEHSTKLFSVEANRRFGETWDIEAEGRFFTSVSDKEFVSVFRSDDFFRLSVSKYF
ncbi:MAG: hypothetical protein JXR03_11115 [Cyclobacteriaceae bacterium]